MQLHRSKALRWINGSDLAVIFYADDYEEQYPYDVQTALEEVCHFNGSRLVVTTTKRDFYERFIADL